MSGKIVSFQTKKPSVRYRVDVDEKSAALIEEMKEFYGIQDDSELFTEALRVMKEIADCYENGHAMVMTKEGEAPAPIRVDDLFPPRPTVVKD